MHEAKFSTAGPKRGIEAAQRNLDALRVALRAERAARKMYVDKLAGLGEGSDPRTIAGCRRGIEAADTNIAVLEKAREREREGIRELEAMIASIEHAQAMANITIEVVEDEDD